jgi:type I protein arginine methyltransferase
VPDYGILAHGMMLGDRRRLDAYVRALRQVVRPGAVVVDIGSGTGVFALVACQAGASRVYAIEAGDIIHAARDIAAANGCAGRIEFIQAWSTSVTLPERADVVVLDTRGILPDLQPLVAADARRRFLKTGGAMLPTVDTVSAALVSAPDAYDRYVGTWNGGADGLDLRAVRTEMANVRYQCRVREDQLVDEPRVVCRYDYAASSPAAVGASLQWRLQRAAVGHGVVAWFDSMLAPGVELSNHPAAPDLIYGQAYFPWPEPIALAEGDDVRVDLSGTPDGSTYGWRWTTYASSSEPAVARFDQRAVIA